MGQIGSRYGALALACVTMAACSDSTGPDGPRLCSDRAAITVGAAASGSLSTTDCVLEGAFADNYSLSTTANQTIEVRLGSTAFDAFLLVSDADGSTPIAANDDDPSGGTTNSRLKLIAAAGTHTVSATAASADETGAYTLSVTPANQSAENCEVVFIERGVVTQQNLQLTDCMLFPPFNDDEFGIYLTAGSQVRIRQNSSQIDTYLELYDPSGGQVAFNDDATQSTTDSQIVYTATTTGFHVISASSLDAGEVGAYTLIVDSP